MIGAPMHRKILKICKNGWKVCVHNFDHLEARWKKTSTTSFYPIIVDVHPYKNISLPYYRVPRKTVNFVQMVPKVHGRANVCAHRKSIRPCNFQICFGAFYRGWYVVVHSCSNFTLRCQMAPLRSIKLKPQIFRFSVHVLLWFSEQRVQLGKCFSLVIMGNGKQVLPVLQWLEVVIAFVSSVLICIISCALSVIHKFVLFYHYSYLFITVFR